MLDVRSLAFILQMVPVPADTTEWSIDDGQGCERFSLQKSSGSIPWDAAVGQLRTPMIGVSIANYDDNQHAQNENLRLGNLWDAIEVYAGLLADLDWENADRASKQAASHGNCRTGS